MKAILWTAYGPPEVLQMGEVEKPTPKDKEVLIKVYASTVTAGDCELRQSKLSSLLWVLLRLYTGVLKPTRIKILGQELAGEIEAVGKDVTLFKPGDRVFAATDFHLSAYAEYTCVPENGMMAIKPKNISYAEAAAIPVGGPEGYQLVRQGNVQRGSRILVVGAGGTIGTYAVQFAKLLGQK